jgi:hypothetical protein
MKLTKGVIIKYHLPFYDKEMFIAKSFPQIDKGKQVSIFNFTTSTHLAPRVRGMELYFRSPIHLHGVVIN